MKKETIKGRRSNSSTRLRRRRKRIARWSVLGIALLALFGVSVVSTGHGGLAAIGAALADPLSVFASRSPGERGLGALTQTKPARAKPSERVKSQVRTHPAAPPGAAGAPPPNDVVGDLLPPQGPFVPQDSVFSLGRPRPYPDDGPSPPDVFPGQIGSSEIRNDTAPIETSVPEPSTWLTMMLGLLVVGVSARRGRSAGVIATKDA